MPTIMPDDLRELTVNIFTALDVPESDARELAAHLIGSNLAGHDSHGVLRIPQYVRRLKAGQFRPGAEITIERETAITAVVRGHHNFGQVTARKATDLAIAKAQAANIGMVTATDCAHVGRVGAYPEMIAAAGLLGMAAVNNSGGGQSMAPYGGIEARTSPNPFSMAVPTGRPAQPFLVDMTASVVAIGKLRVKQNLDAPLPDGWAIKADGSPAQTADDFFGPPKGAVLPMGGNVAHKGFALALMVEALAGALSGAGCSGPNAKEFGDNAIWLLAVNIPAFTPVEEFQRDFAALVDYVKTPPYAPGFTEILVPGEPEHRTATERGRDGIPIDDETWRQIQEVANEVGVAT